MSRTSKLIIFSNSLKYLSEFLSPFYFLSSVLADTLLLYRCYMIWDRNIRVVLGPIILLAAGTGIYIYICLSLKRVTDYNISIACGYVFEGSQPHLFTYSWIYPTLTLILNVILTTLTGKYLFRGNCIRDQSLTFHFDIYSRKNRVVCKKCSVSSWSGPYSTVHCYHCYSVSPHLINSRSELPG